LRWFFPYISLTLESGGSSVPGGHATSLLLLLLLFGRSDAPGGRITSPPSFGESCVSFGHATFPLLIQQL